MSGKAGGGSSSPDLPEYMKNIHEEWLHGRDKNIKHLPDSSSITQLLSDNIKNTENNPYSGRGGYGPSSELSTLSNSYNDLYGRAERLTDDLGNAISFAAEEIKRHATDEISNSLDNEIYEILRDSIAHVTSLVDSDLRSKVKAAQSAIVDSASSTAHNTVRDIVSSLIDESIGDLTDLSPRSLSLTSKVIDTAIDKAVDNVDAILAAILESAYNVVESQIVNDLVEAYDNNSRLRFNRDIGTFSASVAKAGAAQSSAFTIGKALFEIERLKAIEDYEAKIKFQVLTNAMNIAQTTTNSVQQAVIESFKVAHSELVERFKTIFVELVRSYITYMSSVLDSIKAELMTVYAQEGQVSTTWLSRYYALYTTKMAEKNRAILSYLSMKINNEQAVFDRYVEVEKYLESIQRFSYVANREFMMSDLEIDVREKMWDFDVFQKAANVLASASGAVATSSEVTQPQPSAVSTALAGAAVGAKVAGPWGAAAGGAIGLLAGIFD